MEMGRSPLSCCADSSVAPASQYPMSSLLLSAAVFMVIMLLDAQTLDATSEMDEYSASKLYRLAKRSDGHFHYADMVRLGKRGDPRSAHATTGDADQSPHPPIYRFKNEKFNLIRALNLNLKKTVTEPPQYQLEPPHQSAAITSDGASKQAPLRSTLRDILRLGRLPHSPQAFLQLLMM
uniref:Uncharacterized protein n=1 Tax=Plectus sambesii TaxID=2011161 RepID=A0A914WBI3_9BILA